jgi:hypothetical protein
MFSIISIAGIVFGAFVVRDPVLNEGTPQAPSDALFEDLTGDST